MHTYLLVKNIRNIIWIIKQFATVLKINLLKDVLKCKLVQRSYTKKEHRQRRCFSRIFCKLDGFSFRHVFKRGTPKTLHTCWNYIQKCSRPRFFYYYTYTCFNYVQNCLSFDIKNELLPFAKSSALEFF